MLKGKLERVHGTDLIGWIWDGVSERPVTVELCINGKIVAEAVAGAQRRDLMKAKIGSGAHGFRFRLDPAWFRSPLNYMTVNEKATGFRLPQTIEHNISPENLLELKGSADLSSAEKPQVPAISTKRLLRPRDAVQRSQGTLVWDRQRDLLKALVQLGHFGEKQLGPMVEEAFKTGRFEDAGLLCEAVQDHLKPSYRILNNAGRSYLQLGMLEKAVGAFERIREMDPSKHGALFYLGKAYLALQDFTRAYEVFKHCIERAPKEAKYHAEAGRVAVLTCFGAYGVFDEAPEFLKLAIQHLETAIDLDPSNFRIKRELASLLVSTNRLTEADDLIQGAIASAPVQASLWSEAMKIALRLKQVDKALEAGRRALSLDKDSDGAKFAVRILERLASSYRLDAGPSIAIIGIPGPIVGLEATRTDYIASGERSLQALLESTSCQWIVFDLPESMGGLIAKRFAGHAFPWAAGVVVQGASNRVVIWRRDFLLAIVNCGILEREQLTDLLDVAGASGLLVEANDSRPLMERVEPDKVALLVSQYGIYKFGGAEQFLDQMARIYVSLGYRVVMVGTRHDHVGEHGIHKGLAYTFVEGSPEELFRLAIEERASLVHVVSGLGFEIASALRYLNAKLVFGIHFWRELFYNPTPSSGYFPDVDRESAPRPDFRIILDDFSAIYSNSIYTRQLVERHFGIRTPIIYSLPDDVDAGRIAAFAERDLVLLANARADKGFSLLVDIAGRLPHVKFLAIASQSGLAAAQRVLAERDLSNVELLSRVDHMETLYRRARVVLVPSFKFVETFSRVVIEAQRFGVPVVGSDRGNVPYLLTESGTALPEDAEAWATEIDRLWSDQDRWTRRSEAALANSSRYSFAMQKERLRGVVSSVERPVLVGVGSGLGNVIHTTPLIRNLARRLGRRVDVVVAGDYADLLFVAANQTYVNHVFLLNDVVLRRRYDTVFLTHSFGGVTPAFASSNVVASRDWDNFTADHRLHEAEFNLTAAADLLGLPYGSDDVTGYFLGDLHYTRPDRPLIGFHGGSKDGIWASKRWPGYAQLAAELTARGIPVASFGTKDEYVEGTIDMTGGSIEEMANRMLACSAFVANDSGVMNVANALGIPLVALFAPTNAATRGPLGKASVSIAVEKDCAPCEIHETQRKDSFLKGSCRCIGDIEVAEVLKCLLDCLRMAQSI